MARWAPFETMWEHADREASGEPYSDAFIARCREKALEYDKWEEVIRRPLLQDLKKAVPMHCREEVFEGIGVFE